MVDVPASAGPHPAQREGKRRSGASPHTCVCNPVVLLQYFADLRNSIVNSQPPEKQQAMHLCFENLMEGIERNLLTKNRDRWVWSIPIKAQACLRCGSVVVLGHIRGASWAETDPSSKENVCVQVHSEPVGVQERSQRQHEELHIRRQQQRHDELTFHADQSYPAPDSPPPPSRLPVPASASPLPPRARMPGDQLLPPITAHGIAHEMQQAAPPSPLSPFLI